MKPKKQPSGAKARVMLLMHSKSGAYSDYTLHPDASDAHFAKIADETSGRAVILSQVLIIPFPTKRAALAKKKWEGLSYEAKVEAMAKAVNRYANPGAYSKGLTWQKSLPTYQDYYRNLARALLALTGEPSP